MEKDASLYIDVETVKKDCGVSYSKAYGIIRDLNEQLKKEKPNAVIIPGKVNKAWYEDALLKNN